MKTLFLFLFLTIPFNLFADLAQGKAVYDQRCAMCHGATGKGEGAAAAAFPADAKPRDFQKGEFKKVTDDAKFKELLKNGGAALGLSPMMPMQPGLSEADTQSVIDYVRSLKK